MRTTTGRAAFSLIEVLVALAVLSIGIFGVADLLSSSRRTAARASFQAKASGLAQLKLEELRCSNRIAELVATGNPDETGSIPYPKDQPVTFQQDPEFRWQAHLAKNGDGAVSVSVKVTGQNSRFESKTIVMLPKSAQSGATR